jgi:hypothetical protein
LAFIAALGLLVPAPRLAAGVLVTRALDVHVGPLSEEGDRLVLRVETGSLGFPKCQVAWHTMDPAVGSLLGAARLAASQNQPVAILRKLLGASIEREPSTAKQARAMLEQVERAVRQGSPFRPADVDAAEEPAAVPSVLVRERPVTTTLSFDQGDFEGFVNYRTWAMVNGKMYTFTIPQPVFSKTHVDTTVIVNGGGSVQVGGAGVGGGSVRGQGTR